MGGVTYNGNGQSPIWLKPGFESMPACLLPLRQFLVWKAQQREGKWTKVPFNARTGRSGSSTNAQTWSNFDDAKAAYNKGGYAGIGIAMADAIAGVDLDHCIDPETGNIADWAMMIARTFDSYTEKSPSGTGVRILFSDDIPRSLGSFSPLL
jgi:primase-polymerase (primpol)-like protein